MKKSTIGDIEYFINLLYKYRKYKVNEIGEKIKENESDIDFLLSIMKNCGVIISDKNNIIKEYDILFYRKVFNDGNSFYRAFIFGLIEIYILEKKYFELGNLIKFIKLIISMFKNLIFKGKKCDILRSITRLEEILAYVNYNNIHGALELFYNSFLLHNKSLDDFLILFIKFILFYSKKKDKYCFNYQLEEFEIFDLILLPYIFDISLEISFDLKMGKNEFFIFDSNKKSQNKPKIQLCFYKKNSFIYYNTNIYKKLVEYKMIKYYAKTPRINEIIYRLNKKEICQNCNKETKHIAFIEKSIRICENCLNKYVDKIIKERIKLLFENYFCRDIFSKNITLKKEEYYLEDYEYLYLYNHSIIDSIQQKFMDYSNKNKIWICSKCKKIKKNTNKLKCGCYYCGNCLDKIIYKMTNGYMLLNVYEKQYIGKMRCKCGNNMDILSVIEEEEKNNNKFYDLSVERLNDYIKSLCMNCGIKVLNNKNNYKIKIINNKNKNITEDHILCRKCSELLKFKEKPEILCKICTVIHKVLI